LRGGGVRENEMLKSLPWGYAPADAERVASLRHLLAALLRRASAALARLSRALAHSNRRGQRSQLPPQLEFYADASAPEGALYLDGQLIGYLDGVRRL
jgi:hypothetical protein